MTTITKIQNRLTELFSQKKNNVLNIYFTAGFPKLNDTITILKSLEASGADIVEIGMPFSDPLADGPTIQESNQTALENGMTVKILMQQLQGIRSSVKTPIILMGYLNPVMQYGVEKFCKDASNAGVDGIILPDMPTDQYIAEYKEIFEKYNLSMIFLVTPQTSAARLKVIDEVSSGFIYVVSTDSTTGNAENSIEGQESYFKKIQTSGLKNPTLIGFNVRDNKSFTYASKFANGAIIGSAFIKVISASKDLEKDIKSFVSSVKG